MARATPPKAMAFLAAPESSVPVGTGGVVADGSVVLPPVVVGTEVVSVSVSVSVAVVEAEVSVVVTVSVEDGTEVVLVSVAVGPAVGTLKVTPAWRQRPAAAAMVSSS